MATFSGDDSHFVVFFPLDKTIQLLPKHRINFVEDENVSVLFETSNILDDGTEKIEEMPYEGKVVFSGTSASKCRSFEKRIKEDVIDLKKDDVKSVLLSLKELSIEIKNSGKRGASVKLKRAIEEESKDVPQNATKKQKKVVNNSNEPGKTLKSKAITFKEIKMREVMAFAGVPLTIPENTEIGSSSSSDSLRSAPGNVEDVTHETFIQEKSVCTPEKSVCSPEKSVCSPMKTPEKSRTKTLNSVRQVTPAKTKLKKLKSPIKFKTQKTSAVKLKSSLSECRSTTENLDAVNSTVCLPADSGSNSSALFPGSESDLATTVSNSLELLNGAEYSSTCNYSNEDNCRLNDGSVMDNYCISDRFQQPEQHEQNEWRESSGPEHAEYGYNSSTENHPQQSSALQNIVGYYQNLEYEQQTQILSFLHVLTSELHAHTYGSSITPITKSTSSLNTPNEQVQENQEERKNDHKERKLPLLQDKNNCFDDVLVNPSKLRSAEMKALTSKNPGTFLLNKVVDLVYSKEELITAKGVKSLDSHKMEAIKEYMFARCKSLDIEQVHPKTSVTIIQNKIGNLRFKKMKLAVSTKH